MSEPTSSRILGAVLPVVIIGVVLFGFWAVLSMAFAGDGAPSTSILFAIGSILLGAVAITTALWLIWIVNDIRSPLCTQLRLGRDTMDGSFQP